MTVEHEAVGTTETTRTRPITRRLRLVVFLSVVVVLIGVVGFESLVGSTSVMTVPPPCTGGSPALTEIGSHHLIPPPTVEGRLVITRRWLRPNAYRFEPENGAPAFTLSPGRFDGVGITCAG